MKRQAANQHIRFENFTLAFESINPLEAREILDMCNYAGQRPRKEGKIAQIFRSMMREAFTSAREMIHFVVLPNGEEILVDGQHRLEALIISERESTFIVLREEVPDMQTVHKVYNERDQGDARGLTELVRSHKLGEKYGVPDQYLKQVAGAFRLMSIGFHPQSEKKGKNYVNSDLLEAFEIWAPVFRKYYAMKEEAPTEARRFLQSVPVLSIALTTLREAPKYAESFWSAVVRGHEGQVSPATTLYTFLVNNQLGEDVKGGDNPCVKCRIVASAYNAFVRKHPYTRQIDTLDKWMRLHGTKLDGNAYRTYKLHGTKFDSFVEDTPV
jgi:hypothetical protein